MSTLAVRAYAIASTLSVLDLMKHLPEAHVLRRSKTHVVAQFVEEEAFIVAHDFGAVITFGASEVANDRVLQALRATGGAQPRAPLEDDFLIEVDPAAHELSIEARLVRTPQLEIPLIDLVGHVLGQSVAMEYFETDVDNLVSRIDGIAREVAAHGRFRGSVKGLMMFIGNSMVLRNQVIGTLALLDEPPITWEFPHLERAYRELRQVFSVDDRYRSLDHKLKMAQDNLELIADLARHARTMALELGVIALIALEVVLFFVKK